MIIVEPEFTILEDFENNAKQILKKIEWCGRTAYRSWNSGGENTHENFVSMIIKRGHESVLEHYSFSVVFTIDRAIANELVRHRIASFTQESTRYCNFSKERFGKEIAFVKPPFKNKLLESRWKSLCEESEKTYFYLLSHGASPEEARSVLPLSLATNIVVTTNLREWRHILKLRTDKAAHPQMRQVMIPLLSILQKELPVVFDDLEIDYA